MESIIHVRAAVAIVILHEDNQKHTQVCAFGDIDVLAFTNLVFVWRAIAFFDI